MTSSSRAMSGVEQAGDDDLAAADHRSHHTRRHNRPHPYNPYHHHHHDVHERSPPSSPRGDEGSPSQSSSPDGRSAGRGAGPRRVVHHHHHQADGGVSTPPLPLTPSIGRSEGGGGAGDGGRGGGGGGDHPRWSPSSSHGRTSLVLDHHRRRRRRTCLGTTVRIAALIVLLVCALSGPALTFLGGDDDDGWRWRKGGGGATEEMVTVHTPAGPRRIPRGSLPRMKQQALASVAARTGGGNNRGEDSDKAAVASASSRQELLEEAVLLLAANVQKQGKEMDDLRDIVREQADVMTGLLKGGFKPAESFSPLAAGGSEEEKEKQPPPLPAPGNNKRSARRRKQLPYVNKSDGNRKPLNVVLLYADDWRHDTLGCAGNPIVKTPHLDSLARRGVRFANNCVTTSVCWISRATMFTGQYLSRHKNQRIADTYFHDTWNETLYGLLNDAGYHTGYVGKWHNGCDPAHVGVGGGSDGAGGGVDDCGLGFDYDRLYYGVHWEWDRIEKRNMHVTEMNERDALHFLRNRPCPSPGGCGPGGGENERPFALTVSFFATHAEDGNPKQYLPQNRSMELYYVDDTVPLPANANNESFARLPSFFTERNEGRKRYHWRYDTPTKHQTMMKNYYRMATEVDTACGNIVRELERQGVMNDTLVIFTTDNGNFHAEHGLADKWYPHQESIRVPLIIYDPRMSKEMVGTVNDRDFTLSIDLAPTIVSAAGVPIPARMQGRDMSELYLDRRKAAGTDDGGGPWRDEFYYEYPSFDDPHNIPASEALVRKDYKYVLWPEFGTEQIFHLDEDPMEENDLFNSESEVVMSKIVEMRRRMAELKEAAK